MITVVDSCNAKPVVLDINPIPSPPIPLENVTIIAGLNNSSTSIVDEIRFIAQECMDNLSFPETYNISLNYTYSCCMDFYEGTFKLSHSDATEIKYHLEILSNGTRYKYNTSYFYMFNNSDENIIDPEDNQTPGFEFIILLFSAGILLIIRYYKFKEKK
ncbi:MAG: hypothetical protein MUO82_08280 [Candidatus Thermoplasmatota archaeon]|nr:hypothetical protein [Candidatus Thermoplasmatota archaeon]